MRYTAQRSVKPRLSARCTARCQEPAPSLTLDGFLTASRAKLRPDGPDTTSDIQNDQSEGNVASVARG